MGPFQGQNRINKEIVNIIYTCGVNLSVVHCTVLVSNPDPSKIEKKHFDTGSVIDPEWIRIQGSSGSGFGIRVQGHIKSQEC